MNIDLRRTLFKSKEGQKAFEEAGLKDLYLNEQFDTWYEKFLKECRTTQEKDVIQEVQSMLRIVLPNGEQYIVYGETETRL